MCLWGIQWVWEVLSVFLGYSSNFWNVQWVWEVCDECGRCLASPWCSTSSWCLDFSWCLI